MFVLCGDCSCLAAVVLPFLKSLGKYSLVLLCPLPLLPLLATVSSCPALLYVPQLWCCTEKERNYKANFTISLNMEITNQLQNIKTCSQVVFRETPHLWSVFLLCNGKCWIKQLTCNLSETHTHKKHVCLYLIFKYVAWQY